MSVTALADGLLQVADAADLERRFGGLRRLYGPVGYERIRAARVAVVGVGAGPDNWPALLPEPVDVVLDACDQSAAKLALAAWSLATHTPLVCVGAAGGKQQAQLVELADLAEATHDPLLAALRQRLRKQGAPRLGRMGLRCVFSREPVALPVPAAASAAATGADADACAVDGTLNCAGYGSTVTVTATFGMVAAGEVLRLCQALPVAGAA